ncbi:MAG: TolC family protein [Bacteroidales bacterium]|jgi:outer membrane protein TolC|nr:TolC family protein [Bacteroidales bacterium]NCU34445.1 TolC family protein [Candidatus Falkowbacteria bacterium]MDD3525468.1 TolC family protein [Bacteroidales bacterium]MDD4175502.1 TolC family protein [Bacteroidales bacterium]MDD4739953.1 TolC family protein [Bacteroidales bacterium]
MKTLYLNLFLFISLISGCEGNAQSLQDYFKIASQNNPGLQAKYKEFEAALQKVPQVSSLPDPTFSFGYFIPKMGSQRAELTINQMFPWFGTLGAKADAAALSAEAKYQTFLDARNQLFFQVSAAYYPLYELHQWQQIERENIEILEAYKSIANTKFRNGLAPMVDVLRVDIMLDDATTNLEILNQKEKSLVTTFNKLLNRDENAEIEFQDSLEIEFVEVNTQRDSLLANNPLLEALELQVQANKASERAAQKQGLPQLGVGLGYMIMDKNAAGGMTENGKDVLMPMVSASIPIFRKKYKAAKNEAQMMQESYALQKEETANTLVSNYETTWFELQSQQHLIELYDQQIQVSEQALNLLFSAYSNSGEQFEEVLRMQQQLLKYEKMKATAEAQYMIELARLKYLTAYGY